MAIAPKLKEYLERAGLEYRVVEHRETPSASRSAEAAHAPGDRVAKAVLLRDEKGYLLAVLPSTHQVQLEAVGRLLNRRLELASEQQISEAFPDCAVGALPPAGAAYGLEVLLDESLAGQPEVYFEAGDHTRLVGLSGAGFRKLLADARQGRFSHHV